MAKSKKKLKKLKKRREPLAHEEFVAENPKGTAHGALLAQEPEEPRFKRAVQIILDRGEYPGPTAVNRLLGRAPANHAAMRRFSGRESVWRAEVLRENGWVYIGNPNVIAGSSKTWVPKEQARRARRARAQAAPA